MRENEVEYRVSRLGDCRNAMRPGSLVSFVPVLPRFGKCLACGSAPCKSCLLRWIAMIRRFAVTQLNDRRTFDLSLHDDLNIITGKNGSGKTTLLKLMWSMMSGSIERILPEIQFETASLETDRFTLSVTQIREEGRRRISWEYVAADGAITKGAAAPERTGAKLSRLLMRASGSSLFFPTFRRIEGGFAMSRQSRMHPSDPEFVYYEPPYNIEQALVGISHFLTLARHRFIASISTNDIVSMLTNQYANLSEQLNEDHRRLSTDIDELIRDHERKIQDLADATQIALAQTTLDGVREQMQRHSAHQEALLLPFTALSGLIARIFRHRGIQVTSRITLGEAAEAISSDKLSAGEKQMLSFLAYNAFENNSVIFIDEPEISLHVDWQRQLFPTLLSQGTTNQFIVATHSPFIYSSYSDKELLLDDDRGD